MEDNQITPQNETVEDLTKKQGVETKEKEQTHKIRITLSSTDVKRLEKVSNELIKESKNKQLFVRGPIRLPTRVLKITTRKAPSGEGTNTFHKYEMRIHKRIIDLQSPASTVKDITSITMDSNVEVEVTVIA